MNKMQLQFGCRKPSAKRGGLARRLSALAMSLLLLCSLPLAAFAEEYDLANGSITVTTNGDGQFVTQENGVTNEQQTTPTVITQSNSSTPTDNYIKIEADAGTTANVTLDDVNISSDTTPIITLGDGNVTIELDGANTVQSLNHHNAGVRKVNDGNLTITDENETHGSLEATGGDLGAGIGGGSGRGIVSNITITGNAEVTAQGGECGAGIGGGEHGSGNDITITGNAKVTATGGVDGASGIGGGIYGSSSNITVSENAQVKAQGGSSAIVNPNTDDLDEGWIATYDSGTTDLDTTVPNSLTYKDASGTVQTATENIEIEAAQSATCTEDGHEAGFSVDGAVVAITIPHTGHSFTHYISDDNATYAQDGTKTAKCDHCNATDTISDPGTRLPAPAFQLKGQDGTAVTGKTEQKDGILTITVDADFASLTGYLGGLQALSAQGVDTIVFVTNGATSTFALADLMAAMTSGDSYTLTHDGSTVTFTLATGTDISGVLK